MKAHLLGTLVDLDQNDWNMNGKTGTTYTAFVRSGGDREAAQRVRVTEKQYIRLGLGELVEWPVEIYPQSFEGSAPKLKVTLDADFDVSTTDATGKTAGLASVGPDF